MIQALTASDSEDLYRLLARSGIGLPVEIQSNLAQGRVAINGNVASPNSTAHSGDALRIGQLDYRIEANRNSGHLLVLPSEQNNEPIRGRRLIQCGYHKCLTMYYRKVFGKTARSPFTRIGNFTHFFHRLDEFYRRSGEYSISSISGHAIDLDRFEDVLVTRLIRDPRDLLVSGYFYHKRSAESWCDLVDPEDSDWQVVNGKVPGELPTGTSFAQYLNQVPLEQGLIAELSFRERHFDSMLQWSDDDPRVRLFRYEDMVGNEAETYDQMFRFFGFNRATKFIGRHYARRYRAAKQQSRSRHIRNARSGQWRQHFTPDFAQKFNQRYGDLIEKLGYPQI